MRFKYLLTVLQYLKQFKTTNTVTLRGRESVNRVMGIWFAVLINTEYLGIRMFYEQIYKEVVSKLLR